MHSPHARIDFRDPRLPQHGMLFHQFERIITTCDVGDVAGCLEQLDEAAMDGFYAVGYVAYEAAPAFDRALRVRDSGGLPLLWFGISKDYEAAAAIEESGAFEFTDWSPAWSHERYADAFDIAQRRIHDGDTYQINVTFPLHARFAGDARACYARLLAAQSSLFCGHLQTEDAAIISASPELFFERWGSRIRTRPMKGTRRRKPEYFADHRQGEGLALASKDRAENVMIVDLLRNDIGRIARKGTVRVPRLFEVERYPTVWQMTSTVEAEIDEDKGILDIFRALFPCGSVTGAPKVKTMEIIAQLETSARGVYCGAFGIVLPGGDCVFNVPIRTLTLRGDQATYPVGSGVVADSGCKNEYEECLLKSRILSAQIPDFDLLETLAWRKDDGWILLDEHLNRVVRSAEYFGIDLDGCALRDRLQTESAHFRESMRSRILIDKAGRIRVESRAMAGADAPLKTARLGEAPVDSNNPFLYHKTTHRDVYERERRGDADEVILFNERHEVTEGTITNVAVLIDRTWWTPPIECGLLAGTMREELLRSGRIRERAITVDELRQADGVRLMNSVRGWFDVALIG